MPCPTGCIPTAGFAFRALLRPTDGWGHDPKGSPSCIPPTHGVRCQGEEQEEKDGCTWAAWSSLLEQTTVVAVVGDAITPHSSTERVPSLPGHD